MEDRYDISVDIGEGSDMSCLVERVSCWGGKSFVDHDDTHDKVYELNRQMCDIDKHLSEAGYFRMICDGQIETRKKLIDMEEKKTKKMTKAEAFEWLKGKRVVCNNFNSDAIQRKLFEVGMKWRGGSTNVVDFGAFLFVDLKGCLTHCNSIAWFDTHEYEEISADDILSIEIVEDGFSYDKVIELAKPLMTYLNEFGCRDSIRVSQFGIVHEPMSTLIFDNGIGE